MQNGIAPVKSTQGGRGSAERKVVVDDRQDVSVGMDNGQYLLRQLDDHFEMRNTIRRLETQRCRHSIF